jgi:hypothetical protein
MDFEETAHFVGAAPRLFDLAPVRGIGLNKIRNGDLPRLLELPQWDRVSAFHLLDQGIGSKETGSWDLDQLDALLSRCSENLVTLDLYGNTWDAVIADVLVCQRGLSRLTTLDLRGNFLRESGMEALAGEAPHLANLRTLLLGFGGPCDVSCVIGPAGLREMLYSPYLSQLETLDRDDNNLDADSVTLLSSFARACLLRQLILCFNRDLGTEGVRALATSPNLGGLTWLDLSYCDLGERAAEFLLASETLPREMVLAFGGNEISDATWARLAERYPYLEDEAHLEV